MKKKLLTALLISILIFIFMCPLYCFGQKQENTNWGEKWSSLDSMQKIMFFMGIEAGMTYTAFEVLFDASASGLSELSNTKKELFNAYCYKKYSEIHENMEVIVDIITELYKTPENSYIKFPHMIIIALSKLRGEPIEKLLEYFRNK